MLREFPTQCDCQTDSASDSQTLDHGLCNAIGFDGWAGRESERAASQKSTRDSLSIAKIMFPGVVGTMLPCIVSKTCCPELFENHVSRGCGKTMLPCINRVARHSARCWPFYASTRCRPFYASTRYWPFYASTRCWPFYASMRCWPFKFYASTRCWLLHASTRCWPRSSVC